MHTLIAVDGQPMVSLLINCSGFVYFEVALPPYNDLEVVAIPGGRLHGINSRDSHVHAAERIIQTVSCPWDAHLDCVGKAANNG